MDELEMDRELPDSPAEARTRIENFTAETMNNPNHPYLTSRDPRHDRAVKYFGKLAVLAAGDRVNPFDVAMQEKAERDATAQAKLEQEYQSEVKNLQDLGIEQPLLSEGPTRPHHVRYLQQQALLETGKFNKLGENLADDFRTLKPPINMQLLLSKFRDMACDGISDGCLPIGQALMDYAFDRRIELGR